MLTIGVYPRPGWLLRDFLTCRGRNWGEVQPLIAGCWRPRIESCAMQISLVCSIARDRADHPSIDRSVPAVDLPRPSSAARQCGNDGGRSITSIMAGVPFAQPLSLHPSGAKSFLTETSIWTRFFCGGFIRAMSAELRLGAPGNAEPQLAASMHYKKSEAASPVGPMTYTLPLDARVETAPRGVERRSTRTSAFPGRMDYWEESGPHTDSSKVSSEGSWILSSARTNG